MSETPMLPPGVSWSVVSQTESIQPGPSGTYTKGIVVWFALSTGETASVFLPQQVYNANNVRAAINAKAAQLGEIAQLKS